mmetsp:Transcript_5385/g.13485  ORF Transcript_5385/g.13485 Transcript_5385/m.13485 type:complete len:102 (+) Transcript_5385:1154-1459(+)
MPAPTIATSTSSTSSAACSALSAVPSFALKGDVKVLWIDACHRGCTTNVLYWRVGGAKNADAAAAAGRGNEATKARPAVGQHKRKYADAERRLRRISYGSD